MHVCRINDASWSFLQAHVRKAQALVSLGRTEEALREYLVCLSIEPDCRLAKAEAHRVSPSLHCSGQPQINIYYSTCPPPPPKTSGSCFVRLLVKACNGYFN